MTTRLQWRASASASCFYAVARLAAGRVPVSTDISAALAEPTAGLVQFFEALKLPTAAICEHLASAAISTDSNRDLARTALVKAVGPQRAAVHFEALAELVTHTEQAYFLAFPRLLDELELRSRPLVELWESHGPGLLAAVARATDRRLIVEEATVALVWPFLGGGGAAYAAINSVVFEAVLTNAHANLPETLRLAWLVSRLNADLPDFTEALPAGAAERVMGPAMLPAVLDAATDLELMRPGPELLAAAMTAWEVEQPAGEQTAEIVAAWWETARANRTPFVIALAALERMFREA